ncbi:MAG: macro domain-containing protein [Oscillospiraceae bacterium]
MPFRIVSGDITKIKADVIVNAANTRLLAGGGVCGAIFAAAGADMLQEACNTIGGCETGGAVATPAFGLDAKYIIHAVGPVWQGGKSGEEALLRSCYRKSLELAQKLSAESIAFPLISSGIYGYPRAGALFAAVSEIGDFLREQEMAVTLVLFDRMDDLCRSDRFARIREYIGSNMAEKNAFTGETAAFSATAAPMRAESAPHRPRSVPETRRSLADILKRREETFSQMLFRLIDESGRSDPEVYKRANLDRKLFSKIRSNPDYRPSKNTALALAVALELDLDRTGDLLRRAGYALSPASRFDLIVEYFIRQGKYNIFEINEALFAFDESMLGA